MRYGLSLTEGILSMYRNRHPWRKPVQNQPIPPYALTSSRISNGVHTGDLPVPLSRQPFSPNRSSSRRPNRPRLVSNEYCWHEADQSVRSDFDGSYFTSTNGLVINSTKNICLQELLYSMPFRTICSGGACRRTLVVFSTLQDPSSVVDSWAFKNLNTGGDERLSLDDGLQKKQLPPLVAFIRTTDRRKKGADTCCCCNCLLIIPGVSRIRYFRGFRKT